MIRLSGMTWSHPRGYDPMLATARDWAARTGIEISWEKRSLQDFETYPVEELARRFDLIVIDHPHVGEITARNCLARLDVPGREEERAALAKGSVGASYRSYAYDGAQWAFPIDAAAQVMAFRPDLCVAPRDWDGVLALARQGKVTLPLRPPHSLMAFFTLCAGLGAPCHTGRGVFVDAEAGRHAYAMLEEIARRLDPADFERDPIASSEAMASETAELALMPLGYGYVSYARTGFRPHVLRFVDIPLPEARGAALGGTGIAVSAFSAHAAEAIDYAYWLASGPVQSGLYAASGGQPGHAEAWESEAVNAATGGFYRATRATLERSYVRPRHRGYMAFQDRASRRLNEGLLRSEPADTVLSDLNRLYEESF